MHAPKYSPAVVQASVGPFESALSAGAPRPTGPPWEIGTTGTDAITMPAIAVAVMITLASNFVPGALHECVWYGLDGADELTNHTHCSHDFATNQNILVASHNAPITARISDIIQQIPEYADHENVYFNATPMNLHQASHCQYWINRHGLIVYYLSLGELTAAIAAHDDFTTICQGGDPQSCKTSTRESGILAQSWTPRTKQSKPSMSAVLPTMQETMEFVHLLFTEEYSEGPEREENKIVVG
ncbi:uncharacterized protein HD556DRAFT_1304950 [Suillus plorans]|uniref:Uncharacterized protein n=1 Tax=Suillus plorans TaxID=116603 RepID=A0A9P7J3H6_9AGAM|nr:uncharacterized protein HD556DRAFT_1304950 [Suillus plorans]KAG1800995.1 hypothetical protein HD556DRAFT_1304950 [Suillus plorans]